LLRGKDIDGAMVDCMKKAEPAVRAELARSLGARNAASAVPALIETAKDADEAVRVESFKALGLVATEKDLPKLVDLLVQVTGDKARPEAEKAVVTVSKTIVGEDKRAAAVLAVYPKVKAVPAKCSLLTVLGQVGDPNGLKPVFEAAKKGKAEVKDAGIRSLAGWPNPLAVDPLLEIAQASKDETQRALALRGLLRLLEMKSDRTLPQTMAYYEKSMAVAKSVDEKKMVLGGLATVKSAEALKLVEPCLANPDLQKEAALAAEKIKTSLYKPSASNNSGDAGKALDGKLDSRWNSGENQKNGQWFMVDLGAEYEVSKIVLDCTPSGEDYPRGYQVLVSTDANNLGSPVAEGKGTTAVTEIAFPAKVGRYVKIVQTGTAEKSFWSIHEMKIESKSVAQPVEKGKKAK
jgi:HEAT repeat protein